MIPPEIRDLIRRFGLSYSEVKAEMKLAAMLHELGKRLPVNDNRRAGSPEA